MSDHMDATEREELERQLRANGFVTVDDVPFTVKQLALLNWHAIQELQDLVRTLIDTAPEKFVGRRDFDDYRKAMRTMMAVVAALVVGIGSIMVAIAG